MRDRNCQHYVPRRNTPSLEIAQRFRNITLDSIVNSSSNNRPDNDRHNNTNTSG